MIDRAAPTTTKAAPAPGLVRKGSRLPSRLPQTVEASEIDHMLARVDEIIAAYEARPTALIMILQEVQQEFRYLPAEALDRVSRRMDLALSQIYGVATFYKAFSLEARGRHHVCVCTGTACHVRNSRSILEKLERDLKLERGCTSADREFTLETVNCVGACALGPVVLIDGKHYGHLTVSDVDGMIEDVRAGGTQRKTADLST
jgi:NADH-quinone oxidoreductase subunit E